MSKQTEEIEDLRFQGYKVSHDDTPMAYKAPTNTLGSVQECGLMLLTLSEKLFELQKEITEPEQLELMIKAREHVARGANALASLNDRQRKQR